MDFPKVLALLSSELAKRQIDFALVGGLALHAHGGPRSTSDIDVLALLTDSGPITEIMEKLGYEVLHRTENVGNYLSKDWEMGRVDVLFAHRKYSLQMLQRAEPIELFGFKVKVLKPEDLIGYKVQSSSNNSERYHQDMADIETLMRLHAKTMDWNLIQDYFHLFERDKEFSELRGRFH